MTELEKARAGINEVDRQMAALFEQRMKYAETIAAYKQSHGLPIDDPAREEALIVQNCAYLEDRALVPYYTDALRYTIRLSKRYQRRLSEGMRVAFAGVAGAFAEIVAHRIFPGRACVGYPDFAAAYHAVEKGECDCAILPVENSYNGDVGPVMDLSFFGPLHITGLYEARIVQNLLGIRGTDITKIRTVLSHPQALGQCAPYLEKHGFACEEVVNTALAAKMVAEAGRQDLAAIASEEAAAQFGLVKLDGHINESVNNTTRFVIFSPLPNEPSPEDGRFVLVFTVKDKAGELGKAVSVIGHHGFNLRALKSRPTKALVWNYYFFAEGEGNIDSPAGRAMMADLAVHCDELRLVGSYQKEVSV